jgi:hypothetical protein
MSKNSSFRFAIGDDKPYSETWSAWQSGSDFYLTNTAHKTTLKISLHQSGICQVAMLQTFFEKHIEGKESAPEYRDILRWKRLSTPEFGPTVVTSILFASFEFWPERENISAKKAVTWIPRPPDMFGQQVAVLYSKQDPDNHCGDTPPEGIYLKKFQLDNGDFVLLIPRLVPLAEDFFDFKVMPDYQSFITLGIDDEEIDDARGISTFQCLKRYDGYVEIFSLHNMRFMRVPEVDLPSAMKWGFFKRFVWWLSKKSGNSTKHD